MGSGSDAVWLLAGLPADGLFPAVSYHASWGFFLFFFKVRDLQIGSLVWFSRLVILLVPIVFSEVAAHIFFLSGEVAQSAATQQRNRALPSWWDICCAP
jgi:hypothetical protein